jgi:hypothetical protein
MGGPHTLGDLAAAIEWAPTLITASPAVLAASQTKRQSALPLSAARTSATAVSAGEGSGRHGTQGRAGRAGIWNLDRWVGGCLKVGLLLCWCERRGRAGGFGEGGSSTAAMTMASPEASALRVMRAFHNCGVISLECCAGLAAGAVTALAWQCHQQQQARVSSSRLAVPLQCSPCQ